MNCSRRRVNLDENFKESLEFRKWIDYNRSVIKKEQPPRTRGWPISTIEKSTLLTAKFTRVVFLYPFPGLRKRY